MKEQLKVRILGAVILVTIIVVFVPMLLQGPSNSYIADSSFQTLWIIDKSEVKGE